MRILILGKNGQVGWELQRSLAPLGEIVALGRAEVDLEDAVALRTAIRAASADIIVNASAYTAVDKAESEPDRADRVNHVAVGEIGELARDAWVIHYSTDYVFDGLRPSGSYAETDKTAPQTAYGRSKLLGEKALSAANPKHLILRTSWVHAARGHNFIRTILRLASEREALRVVADQFGAPTSAEFIADVTAQAVTAIADGRSAEPGVYHLAAAGETTWHGLARFVLTVANECGLGLALRPDRVEAILSSEYPTLAARPQNSRLDTSKLAATFRTTFPGWETLARRSVQELAERAI